MKKIISIILAALMLTSALCIGASANGVQYTVINPYKDVDWANATNYKACLHCHTTASDGECELNDWLGYYYDAGYDILAITDHGVVNNGWNKVNKTNGIFNGFKKISPLTDEQYSRYINGTDRNGRGMVDVTGGIECNMAVVSKTHVNGYWTTYGQGVWGTENDYETAPREIEKSGGYSVLNHVGDWVNSNNYPERSHSPFYINYFANIFTKYKTCLGMEIINNTDNCTRADRELWDELLSVVIPKGRNIWGFADDDSEKADEVGRSFELFPMTSNSEENVKTAMINGAFFAASKYQKNSSRKNEIDGDGLVPLVTNITINGNTITVECDRERGCDTIEWVSDGKIISTDNSGSCSYTLNLNDFDGELGCYVRFVLKSAAHGVTYSQAFELQYEGRVDEEIPASPIPDNIFGRIFWLWYQRLSVTLAAFIGEKIAGKLGMIPVVTA